MTRFDAGERADVAVSSARAVMAEHPGSVLLSIVLAGLAILFACGLLLLARGAQVQVSRAVDAVELSVFLQPQTTRADAQSLRDRITAISNVADAKLRTREDALTTLVADGMPALSTRPNPLPDVWIVSLQHSSAGLARGSLSQRIADVQVALRALPGVDSVRVDSRWVDLLGRIAPAVDRAMILSLWVVAATLLAMLTGLFFLSGRALSSRDGPAHGRLQALATVGMVAGFSSLILAGGLFWALVALIPEIPAIERPILDSLGRSGHAFVVGMGFAIISAASLGQALGGRRR